MTKAREAVAAEWIERVVTLMSIAEFTRTARSSGPDVRAFDGAQLWHPDAFEVLGQMGALGASDADRVRLDLHPGIDLPSGVYDGRRFLVQSWDVEGAFALTRLRQLPAAALRGQRLTSREVVDIDVALVRPDCSYSSGRRTVNYRPGRCVVDLPGPGREAALLAPGRWEVAEDGNRLFDADLDLQMRVALAVCRDSHRYWHVTLGYVDGLAVGFETDALGAGGAWRLRDIPEGRSRRAAIRHWVSEHYRQSKREDGEATKVREHLRGAVEFVWNGLRVRIVPSVDDRLRNREVV